MGGLTPHASPRFLAFPDRWAAAEDVAVAVDVVDAGDGGPEFVLTEPWGGPSGLAAWVGAGPLVRRHTGCRVRSVFERVIRAVELAGFHRRKFTMDGEHGVAEAVELGEGFAFGGLDHQGAGDRPAHRGSVESEIHEALGDVLDFDAGTLLPLPQVEDAFVRDAAGFSFVKNREMLTETNGHVVGIEDRDGGGVTQGARPHHGDIHPGNDEDAGAAKV